MRQLIAPVLLLWQVSACAGCAADRCSPGTLFLSLSFDDAARAADRLEVQVSIDGAPKSYSRTRAAGRSADTVEIGFDSYSPGAQVSIEITAWQGNDRLGAGHAEITLDPGCSAQPLAVLGDGTGDGGPAGADGGLDDGPGGVGGGLDYPDLSVVTVIAGQIGGPGRADDTGSQARFSGPRGLALDGAGNLFVADNDNHVLRKVVIDTGVVTTLAGQPGVPGYADGIGAAARFDNPSGLAWDGAGSLYVVDKANSRIRKVVVATGEVSTFAGGAPGYLDDVGTAARFDRPETAVYADGTLYVSDRMNDAIRAVDIDTGAVTTLAGIADEEGSADGPGTTAQFNQPSGLALGGGYLYISDEDNHTIRRLDLMTTQVLTIAGTAGTTGGGDGIGAAARFSNPRGLALDGAGNLWVADGSGHRIRQIVLDTGAVSTFAGSGFGAADGVATSALFNQPVGVVYDGAGGLYVSEAVNSDIRYIDLTGKKVTTLAGLPPRFGSTNGIGEALLDEPYAVAASSDGVLYFADAGNNQIRRVDAQGVITTVSGSGSGQNDGFVTGARFARPRGLALDGDDTLYVADTGNCTIRKIDLLSQQVTTEAGIAGTCTGSDPAGTFNFPVAVAADHQKHLYVADTSSHTIRMIDLEMHSVATLAGAAGVTGSTDGPGATARFNLPSALIIDSQRNLYVADTGNHTIRKIDTTTLVSTVAGAAGIMGDANGATPLAARFRSPRALLLVDNTLYVADDNVLIRKLELPGGATTTVAGESGQSGMLLEALPARLNHVGGLAWYLGHVAASITAENSIVLLP